MRLRRGCCRDRASRPETPLDAVLRRVVRARCSARRCSTRQPSWRRISSARHFVEVRRTAGGPAPGGHRAGARRVASARWTRIARGSTAARARLDAARVAPARAEPGAVTAVERSYVACSCSGCSCSARSTCFSSTSREAASNPPRLRVPIPSPESRLDAHACCRLGDHRRLPGLDDLGRPPPHEAQRRARGLLPRRPQPAVVGGGAVGDGHAAERDHDDRDDRPGLRRRHALPAVLFRAAARDGRPVDDARAVLPSARRSTRRTSSWSGASTRRRGRSRACCFSCRAACRSAW